MSLIPLLDLSSLLSLAVIVAILCMLKSTIYRECNSTSHKGGAGYSQTHSVNEHGQFHSEMWGRGSQRNFRFFANYNTCLCEMAGVHGQKAVRPCPHPPVDNLALESNVMLSWSFNKPTLFVDAITITGFVFKGVSTSGKCILHDESSSINAPSFYYRQTIRSAL